jgi:hypothetical protein
MAMTALTRPVAGEVAATRLRPATRVRLKPPGPTTGHVDGAWWPLSRDLTAELPALLEALAPRAGEIEQVTYHLSDWDCTTRRLVTAGSSVRLGGYHTQHPDTLDVISAHVRLTLLVIAPDTAPAAADRVLDAAADPSDTGAVDELLGTGTTDHHRTPRGVRS